MIYHQINKGATDQSVTIRILDNNDAKGTPETAVEHNTSGIDLWYRRDGATKTSITEAALASLDAAHSDGGIEHIGDGYYRLDLPDAAVASGVNKCVVGGTVTGMVVIGAMIDLVDPITVANNAVLATLRDGAHGGTAAVLTLERAIIASTTSNEPGLKVTGNGTAAGTLSTGGATGPGIDAVGGGTSGAGMRTRAAAGNSIGLDAVGAGSGEGVKATGGATGEGIEAVGGATSGSGFKGTGTAGNAVGIEGQGQGSAAGMLVTGGATGDGLRARGGATSGDGIDAAAATSGAGMLLTGASNSPGLSTAGQGTAPGQLNTGGATGAGQRNVGGATSGAGQVNVASAGNSDGQTNTAAGSGVAVNPLSTDIAGMDVYKKNVAITGFMFYMELTDGTPGTGLTVAGQISKDGGAFSNTGTANATEVSNGWYKINLTQTEMNADEVALKFTATGAKQRNIKIRTQS